MIDLSQFVGKNVRVTFRNGNFDSGLVSATTINPMFPYVYTGRSLKEYYNRDGLGSYKEHLYHAWDIIHIEEIKPMNRYEELEKQVAEMQKEIDRLKREEKKYPDLKPVEVIRTVRFTPEEYFKHCEENEFEVTEEGYEEFYTDPDTLNDCFFYNNACTQEIKVMEN